ncbi:MAG: WcaF family extracellular polysaccharide biosynthesis acetyltransferase [Cyanobacteria bacterium J06650_10]
MNSNAIQLSQYASDNSYNPGVSFFKQLIWFYAGFPLVTSYWMPFSALKIKVLRLFGASIGKGVRIKPGVRIKFPWRLTVGDDCWLGEQLWIDNLASVVIEHDVCLSQGVYLCTGNHDWSLETFDLRLGAIKIKQSAWVGARAVVCPGVTVGEGAVLTVNSVASKSLEPWMIHSGNPAQPVKTRVIKG